ncbi:MAG TPA: antitoxin family protein [Pirellulales bacterium]|nr:antitoxin family protein [Pirellulales bacterium]
MATSVFEAVFENGVLRPDRPLPLAENQRIEISVELPAAEQPTDADVELINETSGMLGWTGDAATVERITMDPEFGIHSC